MGAMASQISNITIVYWTIYSGADQRKYQSSTSLAFVRGIHRWPVNSPHKGPVAWKMFPFDDVIMATGGWIHQWSMLSFKKGQSCHGVSMSWLHRVLLICLRSTCLLDYLLTVHQTMYYLGPPTWTWCSGIWICIILLILILAAKSQRLWRIRLLRTPVSTVSSTLWWFGWPRNASLIASDLANCCRSLSALVH